MPNITLTSICKAYGSGPPAVDNLFLEIPDGSFMCLLGPSGCGKTTTLRMIAGLEHPTGGTIAVGGRVLDSVEQGVFVPSEKRGMGLVFQNYALWPHLNVNRNVDFGLRIKKVPAAERTRRVDAALAMMQIDWAKDRYPAQLSGGQQQRVSLARMLAVDPDVLLLDEPLSNLDARLRLEMRTELKRLHDETRHTIVFVTHDQLEAMTMATHVAVMNEGVLQQVGPPLEVYNRPANEFVAQFVGSPPMNLIRLDGEHTADTAALRAYAAARMPATGAGSIASVGIRPEALRLAGEASPWSFEAEVGAVLPTGASWIVSFTYQDKEMFLISYQPVTVPVGGTVRFTAAPADMHAFDSDGLRVGAWDEIGTPVAPLAEAAK